jgi:DNA-binding response OmpR family regulator
VEDDELVAELLIKALKSQHYLVEHATDGQEGWELAEAFEYDLILLDLMLPKLDGISFCKKRREAGDRTPILLLTAQESSTNKVMGLDSGADDYIAKPFDVHELLARIRALLRRVSSTTTPVMEWGSLRLDPSNCNVTYDGKPLHLTAKEYALLELFLRHTQRIFSPSALLDHLWSFEDPPAENTVRAHIKSLRQKLKKAGAATNPIETVYGLGYRLKAKEADIKNQEVKTPNSSLPALQSATVPEPSISTEMAAMWERYKAKYSDRIAILEQAAIAQQEGILSEALQQQAVREAHTLVGSLGSFGFVEASGLSRKIEHLFQGVARLDREEKEYLPKLVVTLRQALEQPPVLFEPQATLQTTSLHQPTPGKSQAQLLIVDDDAELAGALVAEAPAWRIRAEVVCDLAKAREAIARARPDVVLLDLCFPESAENGFELLAELATYQPPLPVLVFTAQESLADRVKVARLGAEGFLQKPVSPARVFEAIDRALQQSSVPEAKLLIVDDDPHLLDFLRTLLEPWGFRLTLVDDPHQFWATLEHTVPDLLILDVEMPDLSGIDLCQVVRNDSRWSELPVLFLSARTDADTVYRVFTVGADDYISKPIVGPELVARILNRLERVRILRNWRKLMG